MKNKNGFTLVELLAVIAILAILVIIALPNVLEMFNNAKKDIFLTETKTVIKKTSDKYISEVMKGNKIDHINSLDETKLIQKSVETQIALLKKATCLLRPGKEMVYSTCSILENENEEVLKKVLKETNMEIVPIDLKRELINCCDENNYEFPLLPVKIPGTICVCPNELFEGFFIAKIKKRG